MSAPLPPSRPDRSAAAAARLAARHATFDYRAAQRAEIQREHAVLEMLMMEQLKNDDEIMKKWIALI